MRMLERVRVSGRRARALALSAGVGAVAVAAGVASGAFAGSALAQPMPAFVGVWRHTEAQGRGTPAFTMTQAFMPNGTFNGEELIAPRPGMVGVTVRWRGQYRATGPHSFDYQVQGFQSCSSGGACTGTPMPGSGMQLGVTYRASVRMDGPRQMTSSGLFGPYETTWLRIR